MFYEQNGPDQEWRTNVRETLKSGVAIIEFEKSDGQVRILKCTLDPTVMPAYKEKGTVKKVPNDDVQAVWDIEANSWRSFRFDKVRTVKFES